MNLWNTGYRKFFTKWKQPDPCRGLALPEQMILVRVTYGNNLIESSIQEAPYYLNSPNYLS